MTSFSVSEGEWVVSRRTKRRTRREEPFYTTYTRRLKEERPFSLIQFFFPPPKKDQFCIISLYISGQKSECVKYVNFDPLTLKGSSRFKYRVSTLVPVGPGVSPITSEFHCPRDKGYDQPGVGLEYKSRFGV